MKKSLLAFVLAFSLVLSVAVPAFAATPADAVGKKEQSAIEELVALGIINGYADGSFKPDNNITRAELAKVISIATGSEKAAEALKNVKSQFKDVKTNEWYTGFINVAAGKGFLLGDKGTGKFRPNDNIKFEEVAAIVVRALGYQDNKLTGAWPYNVLLKAEEVGLFSKVDIAQGKLASRAVVAQLMSNALGENLVEWNADDELFQNAYDKKTGEALILISRLGTTTNQVVTSAVLESNRVVLDGLPRILADNFIITGGKKLGDLLAHKVTVLTDANGRVRAISDNQNETNVISGKLNVDFNNAPKVELKNGSAVSKYDTVTTSVYYLNNDSIAAAGNTIAKDTEASVFLYDNTDVNRTLGLVGKVRAVVFTKANIENALFSSYVVATATADARILTENNSVVLNDATLISINGEAKAATDLAKNDVLDIVYNKDKVALKVTATRNVVEGKVTNKTKQADGTMIYVIDGKNYTAVTGVLSGSKELTKDAVYKLFLNKDGKAAGAELVSGGSVDAKYGIILDAKNNEATGGAFGSINDVFRYYSFKENKNIDVNLNKATWDNINTIILGTDVANTTTVQPTAVFNNATGYFVTWKLKDTDNSIAGIESINALVDTREVKEKKETTLKVDATTYDINANTVVLDATSAFSKAAVDAGDRKVSVSSLANLTTGNKVVVVTEGASTFAKYVIITKKSAADAKTAVQGLFVSADKSGDDYSVVLNIKGTNERFALTGTEGEAIYNSVVGKTATGSVYNSGSNTLVELSDSVILDAAGNPAAPGDLGKASIAFDTMNKFEATKHIDIVNGGTSLADGTLKLDGVATKYYVNNSTTIYIYNKANNTLVTDGIFADVTAYTNETDTSKYSINVIGDASYGNFTLAKAIILVKN